AEISLAKPNVAPRRWYELKPAETEGGERVWISRFSELLSDSIRLRLRSDVPVGSCLSGGLDSTSIVTLIRSLLRDEGGSGLQRTFSAVFPDEEMDESALIKETTRLFGIRNDRTTPSIEGLAKQ